MAAPARGRKKQGKDKEYGEFAHNRTDFGGEELFFLIAFKKTHSPSLEASPNEV